MEHPSAEQWRKSAQVFFAHGPKNIHLGHSLSLLSSSEIAPLAMERSVGQRWQFFGRGPILVPYCCLGPPSLLYWGYAPFRAWRLPMKSFSQWLQNNSLSLAFFTLFALSLAGQSISGLYDQNAKRTAHHKGQLTYTEYLGTGSFLDAIFTNLQGAVLQLGCLILFGGILHQKGASHSRKPEGDSKAKKREGEQEPWVYRNSLSLVFAALFALSFLAHIFFGNWSYNETRALTESPPVSVWAYLATGQFWFKAVQTWQAEFVAIFFFLVFSIFLRQQGSAESKPVESSKEETGETNK